MPTTSNFGWTTPADTDLVKDGAAAIRTLGNGVDTSFVDLKGGTSGQILAKNSATDLDFVWVANDQGDITAVTAGTGISGGGTSGAVTITNSMATEITASGDMIVGTGSGTFDNLPIGSTGQVLTADTTVSPYKVKWATPATGTTAAGCYLQKSGAQSIANDTYTSITWDTETIDTDAYHSTATNTDRITIPSGKGGKYLVICTIVFAYNSTNTRQMRIKKNGTVVSNNIAGATHGNNAPVFCSTVLDLAATDYITAEGWQNSGGSLNLEGNNLALDSSRFSAFYLGA